MCCMWAFNFPSADSFFSREEENESFTMKSFVKRSEQKKNEKK